MTSMMRKLSGHGSQDAQLADAKNISNAQVSAMVRNVNCPQGQPAHLAAAKQYMAARLAGDQRTVLHLVSDNIHFVSQRDGEHRGKAAFQQYLAKTKTEGRWNEPYIGDGGLVCIDGQIKWMGMIPVTVKGVFRFGPDGKIEELFVGKK